MAKVTSQICLPASILKFHLGPFNVDGIFEEWVYPTVSSLMDTGASFFSLIPILDEDSINKFMVDVGITIVIRLLKPFPTRFAVDNPAEYRDRGPNPCGDSRGGSGKVSAKCSRRSASSSGVSSYESVSDSVWVGLAAATTSQSDSASEDE